MTAPDPDPISVAGLLHEVAQAAERRMRAMTLEQVAQGVRQVAPMGPVSEQVLGLSLARWGMESHAQGDGTLLTCDHLQPALGDVGTLQAAWWARIACSACVAEATSALEATGTLRLCDGCCRPEADVQRLDAVVLAHTGRITEAQTMVPWFLLTFSLCTDCQREDRRGGAKYWVDKGHLKEGDRARQANDND